MCEIVTWAHLGFHRKPIGLLNSAGFWDGMLTFLGHGQAEGFIPPATLAQLHCRPDPEGILDMLAQALAKPSAASSTIQAYS